MSMIDKKLFHAAAKIQEQLSRQVPIPESVHLPEHFWNQVKRLKNRISRARGRGWHLAAQRLVADLTDGWRSLQRELEEGRCALAKRTQPRLPAQMSGIYLDLRALQSEFGEITIDLQAHELAVTTEAIELNDVRLGEFQIKLHWPSIGGA